MRPKSEPKQPQRELFQVELEQIIDLHHPLVRLGMCIDWTSFEADWDRPIIRRTERLGSRRG